MLNVYKCSGVVGRVDDVEGSRYRYYTGQTNEASNTVAFNYLLSELNCKIVEYPYYPTEQQVNLLNDIDIVTVALEGLTLLKQYPDKYDITLIGNVISCMIADGKFDADFTDDDRRAANLDALCADFTDILVNGKINNQDEEFTTWWTEVVEPYNYNSVTDSQLNRYNELITDKEKVGSDDKQTLAEYMNDAGPGFLYMFIDESDAKKYNRIIRQKRDIEFDKNFDFVRKSTYGMYDDATILNQFRIGCILKYKMTPERKLEQILSEGGKVGGWGVDDILMLVSILITFLSTLFTILMQCFQLTYEIPDGYESGVPSDEDLNAMLASDNSDVSLTSNTKKILLFGGIGLGAIYFLNKK